MSLLSITLIFRWCDGRPDPNATNDGDDPSIVGYWKCGS